MRYDWNLAKTQFGIVLEYFRLIEVGLRNFFVQEEREEELDLENFCPVLKENKEKGSWT